MATESELKAMLERSSATAEIDLARVIRASRTRRLGKQLVSGGAATIVVATIAIVGISSLPGPEPAMLATGGDGLGASAPSEDAAVESFDARRMPAAMLNLCGAAITEFAPSASGLELTVDFPESAPAGSADVQGELVLSNASAERVSGVIGYAPTVTVSQDGIVVWHSNGPLRAIDREVDLAPGESMRFAASVTPVRCEPADDALEAFRPTLPALPPAEYELSAALDFTPDTVIDPAIGVDLVTSAPSVVTLR